MGSQLFKQFIRKAIIAKQGPPGPAPRQGLQWKPQTHRWIRPKEMSSGRTEMHPQAEFNSVKNDVDEVRTLISNGERFGWSGKDNLIPKRLAETLASIEETIGYSSQEAHESGEGGQTPLQFMVDQVYGALESQSAFGGLQVSSWEDIKTEVGDYLAQNTPDDDEDEGGPERDDFSDYWADFDINEHKEGIHNYVKTVMDNYLMDNEDQYEHLEPEQIKAEIVSSVLQGQKATGNVGVLEDLDIVVPQDDEEMDNAMESITDTIRGSVEHHWKMGGGL